MSKTILALDIATKTGWATNVSSGTLDFKPKRGESEGMRVVRFDAKIRQLIQLCDIDLVVYERPAGRHKASIMVASEMVGVLKKLCEDFEIDYASYSATEVKKYFTGKGNSNKEAMLETARSKYPNREIVDDNEADAIALYELAANELL